MPEDAPETTTMRTALLVIWLSRGERLTTAQVADRLSISRQNAYAKLDVLSTVPGFPLCFMAGVWFLAETD